MDQDMQKDVRLKLIDTTQEWSKQIVTLATGTLVLSATFLKDLFGKALHAEGALLTCWVSLTVAACAGALFLGALSALLGRAATDRNLTKIDVFATSSRLLAFVQIVTFIVGMSAFTWFAWANVGSIKPDTAQVSGGVGATARP